MAEEATPGTMSLARIIRKYLHAFERSGAGGTTACFVVPGVILDGVPRQLWSDVPEGDWPGQDWPAGAQPPGSGDYFIALGEPRHEGAVDPARLPASASFDIGGRQVRQTGALFTVAVRQAEDGWRIAAWTWAKGASGEAEDHA